MPFSDPNEYFRTASQQSANIANMRSQRKNDWFKAMQPVYDYFKQWQQDQGMMERQTQQQGFRIGQEIPAETAAQTGLEELRQRLTNEAPATVAGVDKTRKDIEGMPSAEEASAGRAADISYKGMAGAGIMPWEEEARLRREAERAATERANISASGKSAAENPTEIIWSFLKENLPVSHSDWVKDAQGNWSLEAVRGDSKKVDQVIKEFELTAGMTYKPDAVKQMSSALRTILTTGEPPKAAIDQEAKNLSGASGIGQGAAAQVIKSAYQIINAPFGALLDVGKIALFTPAGQQLEAVRSWLNNYFPGNLGDRMFPRSTPTVPPSGQRPQTQLPRANQ